MSAPILSYTPEESKKLVADWKISCGPHALASAAGNTLRQAVSAMYRPGDIKPWANPTMMENGIKTLHPSYLRTKGLRLKTPPAWGIARVQWEGKWLRPEVPPAAAYAYTHWIASKDGYVLCTAFDPYRWITYEEWKFETDALCARQRYDGWHITYHYLFL